MTTSTTQKPVQVCYWIIGIDNESQPPAVAIDLHDASGGVIGQTFTRQIPRFGARNAARGAARKYARQHGITKLQDIRYDGDSTEDSAEC